MGSTPTFDLGFEKEGYLDPADKISIDLGVASRCRYRTGFGTSKVGSMPWSDLFRPKLNVDRCTVTETPGCPDLDP
jgi:hypothetical protein